MLSENNLGFFKISLKDTVKIPYTVLLIFLFADRAWEFFFRFSWWTLSFYEKITGSSIYVKVIRHSFNCKIKCEIVTMLGDWVLLFPQWKVWHPILMWRLIVAHVVINDEWWLMTLQEVVVRFFWRSHMSERKS
jgi:hypothetical protein